jgi:hypothetical protein
MKHFFKVKINHIETSTHRHVHQQAFGNTVKEYEKLLVKDLFLFDLNYEEVHNLSSGFEFEVPLENLGLEQYYPDKKLVDKNFMQMVAFKIVEVLDSSDISKVLVRVDKIFYFK